MKKLIFMYSFVFLLAVLLLCGCGGNTDTDTGTSTDSDTATEAVDSSIDTTTDTDTLTDTSTDTGAETDTATDTTVDTNTNTDSDKIKKYYREIESRYRNDPEEEILLDDGSIDYGVGLTEDYLKDPIFLDSGFEMKRESQYKIIDSFDELQAFTLLNHEDVEEGVFDDNYVVVILHHFMGCSSGNKATMGFYNGSFENKGATIMYDEFYLYGMSATEDYRDVYRLHFIVVPKSEIEYTDEICKISLNKNTLEQYDLQAVTIESTTDEVNAYYINDKETENNLEILNNVSTFWFSYPYIAIHLNEPIETDYIVNDFKYENGEIFITVEIYERNELIYIDEYYEISANLILVSLRPNRAELEITVPDDIPSDCKVNVIFKNVGAIN